MRKIELKLEALSVESFATGAAADERGTVVARQAGTFPGSTCAFSCPNTCANTCDDATCPQSPTCAESCDGT